MARMYSRIWDELKALPVGEKLLVRVPEDAVQRVVQAVKKEKNREVGIKRKLELFRPGPMKITRKAEVDKRTQKPTGKWIIEFSLEWDSTKL